MNAIRHGLAGHVVVMTSEDQEAYDLHCQGFAEHFQPHGLLERQLTQRLADTQWRLFRAASHESNLLALGNADPDAAGLSDDVRANLPLWSAATVRDHHNVFATLSLYEQRLIRTYEKTLNQLKQLQDIRYWREFRERQEEEEMGEEMSGQMGEEME
ncbi:MAG: hypothetical protein SFV18_09630 [Bryobacteraceae bacterium]|nr:hypothetical protein [Bryobacteraceae bacterium]